MAVGSFWEVRDFQTLFGQQVLNVYHYRQLSDPDLGSDAAVAAELITQWYAAIGETVTKIQASQLNHARTESAEFNSFTAFAVVANGDNGQVSGDCMPVFTAWSFQLARQSRIVRDGHKRVGGVPESMVTDGQPTAAATLAATDYMTALKNPLYVDGVPVWDPVILRVPPLGAPPTVYSRVADIIFQGTSTQNSRKLGRGA